MSFTKSKISLIISSICSFGLLVSTGFATAWFIAQDNIDVPADGLTGSVLQKYFHDGDGTTDHPFQITRPKHYENMVLLHYNLPGFAAKSYNFEFGADLKGDGTRLVYNYKNGKYDPSNGGVSNVLDCTGTEVLPPLGSEELPFDSSVKGNNITISNFKISAKKDERYFSDIGIFGYVRNGSCSNAYFKDFEIETSYGRYTTSESHFHSDSAVHFGYLCGHIEDTSLFTNVYVNGCTLKGSTTNLQINNYGYYGKAEYDSFGGNFGQGNDYQFSLNSQAVYNYLSTTYDQVSDQQLVVRNTRETEGVEPNENGDRTKRLTVDDNTPQFMSQAVSPDSAAGSRTYIINDGYSLSTTGYAAPQYIERRHDYNVYYADRQYVDKDGEDHSHIGEVKTPDTAPIYYDHSLKGSGEGLIVNTETGEESPTRYYYYNQDEGKYYYGESFDRKVLAGYDIYDFDININPFSFVIDEDKASLNLDQVSIDARLYFDDDGYVETEDDEGNVTYQNNYVPIPVNVTYTSRRTGWFIVTLYEYTLHFSVDPIRLADVQEGNHHYSIVFSFEYPYLNGTRRASYVYGGYDENTNTLSQKEILVNDSLQGVNLDVSGGFTQIDSTNDSTNYRSLIDPNNDLIKRTEFVFDPTELLPHRDPRSFETPVLFKEIVDGVEADEFTVPPDQNELTRENFTYIPSFESYPNQWKMTKINRDIVQDPETQEYFLGEESLIYESGYRAKNIDVVGGGAEFYYQNFNLFGNQISIAVLSLNSERTAGQYVGLPPEKGTHFYANELCRSSVVVFLKNTSNPVDNRDDTLGKISFTYVQATILGYSLELVDPTFKKGDSFQPLKNAGTNIVESEDTGFVSLTHNISLELTESDVQQVSYCALDSNGCILGRYDENGDTSMTTEEQLKIDTYVLVLGGQSDNGNDTWITNIDFEYKALDGFGGTFGSVGYRDVPDVIENTILNFYFATKTETFNYSIKTTYTAYGEDSTYLGKYEIECYSSVETTLRIYNYLSSQYEVYVKTSPDGEYELQSGSSISLSIPASSVI